MKYVVARVDGSIEVLQCTAPLALKELQELVGGYTEAVRFSGTRMNRNGRKVTAIILYMPKRSCADSCNN